MSAQAPRARWRGVTTPCPTCGDRILSFVVECDAGVETVLRLRLSAATVQDLLEVLAPGYLAPAGQCYLCASGHRASSDAPSACGPKAVDPRAGWHVDGCEGHQGMDCDIALILHALGRASFKGGAEIVRRIEMDGKAIETRVCLSSPPFQEDAA